MTLPPELVEQVRQRASWACEYCSVTEADSAGQLSVDHFRPRSCGGPDDLSNLLYCCFRCNLYKADYWPTRPEDPVLWNPRQEPRATHLLPLADGRLHPITPTGEFSLRRLRLNRPPLIAYRLQRQSQREEARTLQQYRELLTALEQLYQQQLRVLEEHQQLLKEQKTLLRMLPNGEK